MITAVIAAIAGLAGVAIGRFWDTRAESGRWRRDQRVRGYEDLAKEFYRYRASIRKCEVPGSDNAVRDAEVAALYEHHAIWNERLTSVWVHGSERVAAAAYALDHELSVLVDLILQPTADSDRPARREAVHQRFDDYVDAVRADLSLPHLLVLRTNSTDRTVPAAGRG